MLCRISCPVATSRSIRSLLTSWCFAKSECRLLQPADRCHDTDLRADLLSPLAIVPLSEMTEKLLAPTPAVLTLDYVENNILSLKFTGDNILYEEAFMETVSGEIIEPLSVDSSKGVINFPFCPRKPIFMSPSKTVRLSTCFLLPIM